MYQLFVSYWYADCWICFILCKDNANERNESLLSNCRVQLIFCKDNANERNESLLSNCRVQLIFCKDSKKKIKKSSRSGNSYTIIINNLKKIKQWRLLILLQTTAVSALFWVKWWRTIMYLVLIWCFMLGCIRKTFLQSKRVRAIIGSVFMWGLFLLFGTLSKTRQNTPEWSNDLSKQPSMMNTFIINNWSFASE